MDKASASHHTMVPRHTPGIASSSSPNNTLCAYYALGESPEQQKRFLHDVLNSICSGTKSLFFHEHFTPVTRLTLDIDHAGGMNLDDLFANVQSVVRKRYSMIVL